MPEIVFVRQTGLCIFGFRGRYPIIPYRGCVSRPRLRCVSSQLCLQPFLSLPLCLLRINIWSTILPCVSLITREIATVQNPPAFLFWGSQLSVFYLRHPSFSDWFTGTLSIWKAVPFGCEVTNSRCHFLSFGSCSGGVPIRFSIIFMSWNYLGVSGISALLRKAPAILPLSFWNSYCLRTLLCLFQKNIKVFGFQECVFV